MKPGFFIIGAARSGTTSLYAYLDQHPDILFSQVKEINFFSNPSIWKKGVAWYENQFDAARNGQIAGEASTSYTSSPFLDHAPKRLAEYNSQARIIYIVRDPIDRMVSHYMHRVHRGMETRDFSDLIDNLENEPTAWQGRYHYQIEKYLEYFERNQILIIAFDDLHQSTETVVRSVFDFLGVDSNVSVSKPDKVYNSSSGTLRRSDFGRRLLRIYRRHVEQKPLPYAFKSQFLKLARLGASKQGKPELTSAQYGQLKKFYADDVEALKREFGIDTNRWLSEP